MHKQKPNKGLGKRVRVTAKGKVKFRKAFNGHLRSHKTGKKIRQLRRKGLASAPDIPRLRKLLGQRVVAAD